jgi:hypothetical protein
LQPSSKVGSAGAILSGGFEHPIQNAEQVPPALSWRHGGDFASAQHDCANPVSASGRQQSNACRGTKDKVALLTEGSSKIKASRPVDQHPSF